MHFEKGLFPFRASQARLTPLMAACQAYSLHHLFHRHRPRFAEVVKIAAPLGPAPEAPSPSLMALASWLRPRCSRPLPLRRSPRSDAESHPEPRPDPDRTPPRRTLPNRTLNRTLPSHTLPSRTLPSRTLPSRTLPSRTLSSGRPHR